VAGPGSAGTPASDGRPEPSVPMPAPGPGPSPSMGAPARPTGRRFPTMAVVAVVVAALAFTAGLAVEANVHHGSTAAGVRPLTYDQALSPASTAARGFGVGWEETAAIAVDADAPEIVPPSGSGSCGIPGFYIPRETSSIASGASPFWLFGFVLDPQNPAPAELDVVVENGSATVLVSIPAGTVCSEDDQGSSVITGTVADSPAVAANASQGGGATFLAADPQAVAILELTAGTTGPSWTVEYSGCDGLAGTANVTGNQSTLDVSLSGVTGRVLSASPGTTTCVSRVPYLIGLTPNGSPGTLGSGASYETFTVTTNALLPLAYLAAYVVTSSDAPVYDAESGCPGEATLSACPNPAYGWYLTTALGGTLQATYYGSPGFWLPESGTAYATLASGETLTVVSTTPLAGSGDVLELVGTDGPVVESATTL